MSRRWTAVLRAERDAARAADDRIQELLDTVDLPPDCAYRVQLVVSELVTNAVLHGYQGATGGPIRLEITIGADRVSVAVEDEGSGLDDDPGRELPVESDATTGRGMFIVRQIATEVEVTPLASGGTRIVARLPIQRDQEEGK